MPDAPLRPHHNRLLVAALVLAALWLLLSPPSWAADQDDRGQREQLAKLNREMQQLQGLIKEFKTNRSDTEKALRQSEVAIGKIRRKINRIQTQISAEQKELNQLTQKRGELNASKHEQQKLIEQQVLAAFKIGQQKKLKVLLNQQQPEKITRALTYYDYFNRARAEQIQDYVDTITQLNTIEPKILETAAALNATKTQLSAQYDGLKNSQRQRKKNLNKINAAIKTNDQKLKKLSTNRQELEKLLNAVEQAITNIHIPSDYRPFQAHKGKLAWPVKGRAKNRFGNRRSGGKLRWQGVMLKAKEGSTVKSIHHGRVVFADWFRGSGLLVIVDHGDGYMSLYAHNQSLLIEPGDWVSAGEPIATVGNSGGQNLSGLYFEIRHNGEPTDPHLWCNRA